MEGSITSIRLKVTLKDGETYFVTSEIRDTVAFERVAHKRGWPMITEGAAGTYWSHLAFTAGKRDGHGDKDEPFEAFLARTLAVDQVDEDDDAADVDDDEDGGQVVDGPSPIRPGLAS